MLQHNKLSQQNLTSNYTNALRQTRGYFHFKCAKLSLNDDMIDKWTVFYCRGPLSSDQYSTSLPPLSSIVEPLKPEPTSDRL